MALKYKTYPKMKDSGIEWIGEIPEHWNKKRLKFSVHLHSDKSNSGETRPYLGLENIESGTRRLIDVNYEMEDADAKLFETDDVLFGKLRPYLAKVFLAKFSGRCSGEFLVFTGIDFIPEFLASLLISDGCIKIVDSSTYGTKMPRAEWDFIGNMTFTIPPKPEQKQISDYLDSQTKQIDSQIQSNQKLVTLLQEKRQATINQAVTKGLDPTVPMKDSGIEWIGEMPEHWNLTKLKNICIIERGKFTHRPRNDPALYDGQYPFIQTGDVENSGGRITSYSQTLNEKGLAVSKMFPENTVVMTIAATIGSTAVTTFPVCFPDSIVGFRSSNLYVGYLNYFLKILRSYLEGIASVTTQKNIDYEFLKPILIPDLKLEEQKQISDYLDKQTAKIDSLISKTEAQIEKLQEFRQSLISSAVTGKIDVRELT